jgi:hypothetical protein
MIELRQVMILHSVFSLLYGLLIIFIPHGVFSSLGSYNYLVHESSRLYGCLSLGIGWLLWSARSINDGRFVRATTEAFLIAYITQGLVMLKAFFGNQISVSSVAGLIHLCVGLTFLSIGCLYAFVRFGRKIKDFELPGVRED